MDAYRIENCIAQASIGMIRGEHLRIENGRGTEVSVTDGSAWITQDQDTNDVCLVAGESFRIDRDGVTFVSALQPSLCRVTPAATVQLRVSMIAVGTEPVELFAAGARSKPRPFAAWRCRFRGWRTAALGPRPA